MEADDTYERIDFTVGMLLLHYLHVHTIVLLILKLI